MYPYTSYHLIAGPASVFYIDKDTDRHRNKKVSVQVINKSREQELAAPQPSAPPLFAAPPAANRMDIKVYACAWEDEEQIDLMEVSDDDPGVVCYSRNHYDHGTVKWISDHRTRADAEQGINPLPEDWMDDPSHDGL